MVKVILWRIKNVIVVKLFHKSYSSKVLSLYDKSYIMKVILWKLYYESYTIKGIF